MFEIRGIGMSSNTTKILYVAEELGLDYKFIPVDLGLKEHKSAEHLLRHPLGKVPTLTYSGKHLFESGAICRFLASHSKSELYPVDSWDRAKVDQWMDFFTTHLGRWISTYAFENVVKAMFNMGEPNPEVEKEALGFIEIQMACVNEHFSKNKFFLGEHISIADHFAFAYLEQTGPAKIPLEPYQNLKNWYQNFASRESVLKVHKALNL